MRRSKWVKRCPNPMLGPSEIEIRPLFEAPTSATLLHLNSENRKSGLG